MKEPHEKIKSYLHGKAENLKSCAHFMSCDYEKLLKEAYKVNSWENTTNPPH
jgi:hypothetical protein